MIVVCSLTAAFAQSVSTSGPELSVRTPVPSEKKPGPEYTLGPGDQIKVHVVNVDELGNDPLLIDLNGTVALPYVGRVKMAGYTTAQAEEDLKKRYAQFLVRPDVTVAIMESRSQPLSVFGAVKAPGVQQVQGRKTLIEALSAAGGLADNAGSQMKLTRRMEYGKIPLPDATTDSTGQFSVAEISLKSLFEAKNPQENVTVLPYDVISIPVADTVYVMGHVQKAGGYVLTEHEKMTVLGALSMAGGTDNLAQPKNARILRRQSGVAERAEIAVNLNTILEGKTPDVAMQPEDILYVPNNLPKSALLRGVEAAIQTGTGVVIWRR
jgi:polysaccharide export outer membrane protein